MRVHLPTPLCNRVLPSGNHPASQVNGASAPTSNGSAGTRRCPPTHPKGIGTSCSLGQLFIKNKIKRQDLGREQLRRKPRAGQCSAGGPHGHGLGGVRPNPGPQGTPRASPWLCSSRGPRPGRRPRKKLRVRPAESERDVGVELGGGSGTCGGGRFSAVPGATPHSWPPQNRRDRQPGGAAGAEGVGSCSDARRRSCGNWGGARAALE